MRPILALAIIATIAVCSCSSPTVESQKLNLNAKATSEKEGMIYSLPIGYIKLVAELQESQPKAKDDQKAKSKGAGGGDEKAEQFYKITVTPELIPDQNHTFLLTPRLSAWANDSYSIGVKDGLLTSLNSTNADQSATVLTKLAGLAGVIAKTGILTAPKVAGELPKRIEVFFLPGDTANANKTLAAANLTISIAAPKVDSTWKKSADEKVGGIAYRPLLPYQVTVEDSNSKNVTEIVILLPNDSPVLQLVPRRSALVTRKTSITFDKGVPTAVSFDRNSTAVAWASLPIDMAKAFLSVPTELVQLKFNYVSTNNQLQTADVTSEVTRLTKELEALRLQFQINEFNRTNSASTGP